MKKRFLAALGAESAGNGHHKPPPLADTPQFAEIPAIPVAINWWPIQAAVNDIIMGRRHRAAEPNVWQVHWEPGSGREDLAEPVADRVVISISIPAVLLPRMGSDQNAG